MAGTSLTSLGEQLQDNMPNNGKGEKAMLKRAKLIVMVVKRTTDFMIFLFAAISILSFAAGMEVLITAVALSFDMRALNELVGFDLASLKVPLFGAFFCSSVSPSSCIGSWVRKP